MTKKKEQVDIEAAIEAEKKSAVSGGLDKDYHAELEKSMLKRKAFKDLSVLFFKISDKELATKEEVVGQLNLFF